TAEAAWESDVAQSGRGKGHPDTAGVCWSSQTGGLLGLAWSQPLAQMEGDMARDNFVDEKRKTQGLVRQTWSTHSLGKVSEMPLPQKKRWESMAKGLVLGALFTSFLLLLYSYAVPPLHTGLASTTPEGAAPCSPALSEPEAPTPANGSAGGCQPRRDILAEFLQDPDRYYDPHGYNAHYLRNLLFFDLGYDSDLDPRSPQVQEHILEVERRFHLVLLQEYFDESLVLLKDLLCWELEDVLYFKLNARRASARMAREVAALRRANERMRRICIDGGHAVDATAIQDSAMQPWQPLGTKSILGYNLKKSIGRRHAQLCRRMLTPEIQYLMDLGVNL
ncbi:hypothetical protein E2I00_010024, partial [Balaenoptera physalus]